MLADIPLKRPLLQCLMNMTIKWPVNSTYGSIRILTTCYGEGFGEDRRRIKLSRAKDEESEPKFVLDEVQLRGSFKVKFSKEKLHIEKFKFSRKKKWTLEKFDFQPTKITGTNVNKLAEASKAGTEVSLKFGNGEGKAIIGDLHYDPESEMLTFIVLKLTEWIPK